MTTQGNFVVIAFKKTSDGFWPGRSRKCANAEEALIQALTLANTTFSGAIAVENVAAAKFKQPEILGIFGEVPEDLRGR